MNLNIETGQDHEVTVVYTKMASCYFDHGEIEKAIEHQMKAKKIADEQLGYCPISATIYDNLAYYYHATNRDEEAATALKKCMAINEKVYGNDYPDYQDLQLRLQEYESNKSK